MSITRVDLLRAANEVYTYETFTGGDPVDNFSYANPLAKWFMSKQEPSPFLQGLHNETLELTPDDSGDWYRGDDQQTYQTGDPPVIARFQAYNKRKGFTINMEDLADAGIQVTEGGRSNVTSQEKGVLVNMIKQKAGKMKTGLRMDIDLALHGAATEGGKVAPGLGLFVPISPSGNTIGGVSQSTYADWENYAATGIDGTTSGDTTAALKAAVRAIAKRGKGIQPEIIIAGGKAYDAYAADCGATVNRQIIVNQKGGTGLDAAVTGLNYSGIPVVYDPILDYMQADDDLKDDTHPFDQRFYLLSSQAIHFRPREGRWMRSYMPMPTPDRPETLYWGLRTSFGLTVSQLNALGVLVLANA